MIDDVVTDESLKKNDSYVFGLHTVRQLFRILAFIFKKHTCVALFFLIGLISLLQEYVVYNIGIIASGYYRTLTDKDWNAFVRHTISSSFFILAVVFLVSSKQYITNAFYVLCRHVLTMNLQKMYFDSNKFYYINTFGYDLTDNPDQRITQDIDKFSFQFSVMLSPLIVSPFTITYYSYACFTTMGWIGPVVIYSMFLLSVIINKFLIRPIMNRVVIQEKCEGYFRFKHMHVRSHAESIAFQDGQKAELLRSEHHLNNLISAQHSLFVRQYFLSLSTNTYDYISSILSYLILAGPLFYGDYSNLSPAEIGALISKNSFVSIYLISCFSKLIDLSTSISQIAGLTYRVSELIDLVTCQNKFPSNTPGDEDGSDELMPKGRDIPVIELRNVTFGSPIKGSVLVAGLSLDINLKENLLVTGNSSSGKTSFVRVVKGLWPILEGEIRYRMKLNISNIFFLSQKPLVSDGTFLHQLLYPKDATKSLIDSIHEMEKIKRYVEYVDLQHVVEKVGGYHKELDWHNILSPGELQRLSFVRLYYHQPKLAFLDEATSGVALEMEEKLYEKCKELNITVVTIGHRTSLNRYHDKHLHLEGNGSWGLVDIN